MPGRITALSSGPKTVTAGGKPYPAWECRLCDLMDLQAWLDSKWADPLPGLLDALDGAGDDGERDGLIVAASDAAGDGPPEFGSPGASAMFATAEGVTVFLSVAMRLTPEATAEVYTAMTPAEYAALRRVFFGVDSVATINRMLFGPERESDRGEPVPLTQAIDEVAEERGWTYDEVLGMTLGRFKNARRRGQPLPIGNGEVSVSTADLARKQDELCRKRYGMSAKDYFASLPPDDD